MAKRANGEGSAFWHEKRGRWIVQALVPGTKKVVSRTVQETTDPGPKGEAIAEKALIRLVDKLAADGEPTPQMQNPSLREWLTGWADRQWHEHGPQTARTRQSVVSSRIIPIIGHIKMRSLTTPQVRAMVAQLTNAGYAPSTIKTTLRVLSAALNDAKADGIIKNSPVSGVSAPHQPHIDRPVVTIDKRKAFYAAISGTRLETMYLFALETGLRRGELQGLRWADVRLDVPDVIVTTNIVRAKGGGLQRDVIKGRRARAVPLTDAAVFVLERQQVILDGWRRNTAVWLENDLIWPAPMGGFVPESDINTPYREALQKAGLPPIRLHDLRHSFATAVIEETGNLRLASELLGHSSTTVTGDIYTHVTPRMASAAREALNKRNRLADGLNQGDVASTVASNRGKKAT